jgi:hypothetical protein
MNKRILMAEYLNRAAKFRLNKDLAIARNYVAKAKGIRRHYKGD